MSKKEIMLRANEDGKWSVYEPYTTIVVDTEEDYKFLEDAVAKQKPKKVNVRVNAVYDTKSYHCPNCESNLTGMGFDYCVECGQKIDWGD